MPSLSVRSLAEMLNLPAHAQARILTEQKHPKQAPQVFRTPYYQQSLAAIRAFYKSGNQKAELLEFEAKMEAIKQEARRENNLRVLRSFRKSDLSKRNIELLANKSIKHHIGSVELRLSPDLSGVEGGDAKFLFINFRAQALEPELARSTIEITHWLLEQAGHELPINDIQYVDLYAEVTFVIPKRRASTVKAVSENLKIIEALWPTL